MPHSHLPRALYRLGEHAPQVHESVWIAPTAAIIGRVEIGAGSGVWFGCVLRGDANYIRIGERTNIQDGTIVHVDPGDNYTVIGDDVTVGHACIIHGCRLEDKAFVGMGSTVLNRCVIEGGGMLGAGSLLTAGKRIKTGELWAGVPAVFRRALTDAECEDFAKGTASYVNNARRFLAELQPVP
ncbi:MAG: gamma carbonic anhydrase family protein [Hyphomicrobiaceae bacterium]